MRCQQATQATSSDRSASRLNTSARPMSPHTKAGIPRFLGQMKRVCRAPVGMQKWRNRVVLFFTEMQALARAKRDARVQDREFKR